VVQRLTETAVDALASASAILVSDYGRGVTGAPGVADALHDVRRQTPVVGAPRPRGAARAGGARLVPPTAREPAELPRRAGLVADPATDGFAAVCRQADALVRAWGVASVAVTMGAGGALLSYGTGAPVALPAPSVPAADPCGAGDRFAATPALALASGAVTTEAVQAAVLAAWRYVAAGGPASLDSDPAARA